MRPSPQQLLAEYASLKARRHGGTASEEELRRIELLEDVLLELGALNGTTQVARSVRAPVALSVSFSSKEEVTRAYSSDIGKGGIGIRTEKELEVGSPLKLTVELPDGKPPLRVLGKVAWTKRGAMGVAFEPLAPADEARLRAMLLNDRSVLEQLRGVLGEDVRVLASKSKERLQQLRERGPAGVVARETENLPGVLLAIEDAKLRELAREVLTQGGVRLLPESSSERPAVVVACASHAVDVMSPGARLVLVNVSGPDSLVGRLAQLRPHAYIRRPASAASILQTVANMLPTT